MTSQQTDADATPSAEAPVRPFRRRATARVLGGVASGIADYLNVDPLLIRAAFVGLVIFGGAGFVLYLGAWLFIPVQGRSDSIAEAAIRRVAQGRFWMVVLIILGAFAVLAVVPAIVGEIGADLYVEWRAMLLLLLIIVGVLLLRRGGPPAANPAATPPAEPLPFAEPLPYVEPQPRAPRSPLAWYIVAVALIGIGLLALGIQASSVSALPGYFFGLVLGIVGIGLLVGAWWGHARILILPALLVLPFAVASIYVTAPLEGGTGDHRFTPVTQGELQSEYRLVGGRLTLDLRELPPSEEPVSLAASVALGELSVILPAPSQVEIDTQVGAGLSLVMGTRQEGTHLADRYVGGTDGPHFILDLEAGIGQITVETTEES